MVRGALGSSVRTRPSDSSMACSSARSSARLRSVDTSTAALKYGAAPSGPPTATVSYSRLTLCTSIR